MPNLERKTVLREVGSLSVSYTSAKSLIDEIERYQKLYGEDLKIDKVSEAYSDYEYVGVFANRPETDKEYDTRIAREIEHEEAQQTRDKWEYERLRAKYGNQ